MKTILVVEDESLVMRLFRHVLREYAILEAATAEEALRQFRDSARHVDLLITDLTLPTSSGTQVALLLRSMIPALPVILASGCPPRNWTDQDSDALGKLGTESVIVLEKPFFPSVLLHKVHQMIGAPGEAVAATFG
ncbi:putative Response regulator receiver protein [Candidatus Sulfopaludibacter sp. SbA6]|nr:putative Response regulator receiver protein [Candidatus Sulfopaludibacter sp. SbA6]